MGRHRGEGTVEAFRHILREGGPAAFWRGTGPKMVESATKVSTAFNSHTPPGNSGPPSQVTSFSQMKLSSFDSS